MRTLGLSVIFLVWGAFVQAGDFDRKAWLSDYARLKQALEKSYSNLAWFASPEGGVDLPALDRRTLAALKAAGSDEDARSAILTFVRGFHDGHFSQLAMLAPASSAHNAIPDDPVYARQDAASGCAALGYAPNGSVAFSLKFESLPGFSLLEDGISQPFRAGILTSGTPPVRLGIVRIPRFEATSHPSVCMEAWLRSDVWNEQGKFVGSALAQAAGQNWYQALATILHRFKTLGAAAVMVDISNNSGGDDSGDIAARLFTAIPLHSAPLWMSQDPKSSMEYFDEQMQALNHILEIDSQNVQAKESLSRFTSQKAKLSRANCAMDWVWREQRSWKAQTCRRLLEAGSAGGPLSYLPLNSGTDPRVAYDLHWPAMVTSYWGSWSGPLYVLTNSRTYSAAEMFAAVLQNNHAAKIIGGRTGGDGCGFMNSPEPVTLPHSGLRFRVPNCVRIRVDGTDEVAGIQPDIPVLQAAGENSRAFAARVLDQLLADLQRNQAK